MIAYDNHYNRLDATKSSTIYLFEELIKNTKLIRNSNTINHHSNINNDLSFDSTQQIESPSISMTAHSKFYHNPSLASLNQGLSYPQSRSKSFQLSQQFPVQNSSRSILTYAIKITLEIIKLNNPSTFDFDSHQLFVNLFNIKDTEANYLWLVFVL